jgi:hypothetical protein
MQLRGGAGDETPILFSGFLHAARGERDKIDPSILVRHPADALDGDDSEWIGSLYALLGDKTNAMAWLRRSVALGNHNYPWFRRDKNYQKLHGDPDYERLMREVEGYWKSYVQEFAPGT